MNEKSIVENATTNQMTFGDGKRAAAKKHLHRANHNLNAKLEHYANKHGKSVSTIRGIFFGGVAAVLLVLIIVVLLLTVFSSYMVSGDVKELSMYATRTVSQIEGTDGTAGVAKSNSFNYGDPIIVKLDLHTTGTEEKNYIYEVTDLDKRDDDGNPTTVRKGSFPVSPTTTSTTNEDGSTQTVADDSSANTVRYISIVSSVRTALEAGNYELVFKVGEGEDAQIVGKMRFSIHGSATTESETVDTTPAAPTTAPEESSSSEQSSEDTSDSSSGEDNSNE